MKKVDLTDHRFGSLVAIRYIRVDGIGNGRRTIWLCLCDCGCQSEVSVGRLRSGHTLSCGCRRVSVGAERIKHGCARRAGRFPEYRVWANMLRRCRDPLNPAYQRYGGRGIHVCSTWEHSFANFLMDMGRRPSPDHTLERVNNNSGYDPTNCVWATRLKQGRNKSNNHVIEVDGAILCLQEWAEKTGIHRETIAQRIRRGWTPLQAISEIPVHP